METLLSQNRLSNSFDESCLQMLAENIRQRVPFYVRMQISSYEARVAYLLNAMVTSKQLATGNYFTFFCSSTSESLSGAVKVVRHNLYAKDPNAGTTTAVYDPTKSLREIFDPFGGGIDEALVPGFIYFEVFSDFEAYLRKQKPPSIMLRDCDQLSVDSIEGVLSFASSNGIYSMLDESSTDLRQGPLAARLSVLPDVIAFGENLGDNRVPTGCFLIKDSIFHVWNSGKDYNIHSNTWGGNSASLSRVLGFIESTEYYGKLPSIATEEIRDVVGSHHAVTKMYERNCSPKMAAMLNLGGLNKDIKCAQDATISTVSRTGNTTVVDASGTYGVNLRGHNPQEVLQTVVECHDTSHDYWEDLERLLEEKTGLPRAFPTVSGATSTEAALTIGLLASAPKKRIVAMKGGFSGKTLLSLVSTSRDRFKLPFQPLYPHITYVDPFGGEGESQLRGLCKQGDVGVVILETVQGEGGVRAIPQSFLDALIRLREEYGYYIIVDEVQTGMYRTGRFLNYQGKLAEVDIVAMGKAMSGNVFPVSATLTTEQVFQRASIQNLPLVKRYYSQFRCEFGAHIAIDSIRSGEQLQLAQRAKDKGIYFLERLRAATADLKFVKDVRGEGLMVGIEFDEAKLPALIRDSFGGLIASRCINDSIQPVLTAFNPDKPFLIRFVPPLCITTAEIDAVVATMNRALRSGVFGLLKPVIKNVFKSKLGRY
jgi:acetylornithine/succinyldiaminopimelate/putrescine aminotransferase